MTMLAHVHNGTIVARYASPNVRIDFGDGHTVSPLAPGYTHGDHKIVPLVEETVDQSTTPRTERAVAEIVEAERVLRIITITDIPVTPDDVRAHGARLLRALAAGYSAEERETWHRQVEEARAVIADPAASAPLVAALAAADGVTASEMAAAIIGKADAYAAASGAILAAQRTILAMDPLPLDYDDPVRWPTLP